MTDPSDADHLAEAEPPFPPALREAEQWARRYEGTPTAEDRMFRLLEALDYYRTGHRNYRRLLGDQVAAFNDLKAECEALEAARDRVLDYLVSRPTGTYPLSTMDIRRLLAVPGDETESGETR